MVTYTKQETHEYFGLEASLCNIGAEIDRLKDCSEHL